MVAFLGKGTFGARWQFTAKSPEDIGIGAWGGEVWSGQLEETGGQRGPEKKSPLPQGLDSLQDGAGWSHWQNEKNAKNFKTSERPCFPEPKVGLEDCPCHF